jgi:hypothetical protein
VWIDYRRELLALLGAVLVMSTGAKLSFDYWLTEARLWLAGACGAERQTTANPQRKRDRERF